MRVTKHYYAQYVRTTAKPGKRDELIQRLQDSVAILEDVPDCVYYLISTTDDPDVVCISELWTSREAKDAFGMRPEVAQAMRDTFVPLVASMGDQAKMTVVGGVGIE
jgi:quinol monooxygenase YgiN